MASTSAQQLAHRLANGSEPSQSTNFSQTATTHTFSLPGTACTHHKDAWIDPTVPFADRRLCTSNKAQGTHLDLESAWAWLSKCDLLGIS